MGITVHKDPQGPDWPVGNIVVVTPGTPVNIMSLVDPTSINAPETPTGPTSAEYTVRANQILFQAFKAGAAPPLINATGNTGNIYVVRKATAGNGGVGDVGVIVAILTPGQTFNLASAALNRNDYDPYRYFIDGDTAANGCQVTLFIA